MPQCQARVHKPHSFRSQQCSRKAVVDNRWCKQHSPEAVAKRDAERTARYREEMENSPFRRYTRLKAFCRELLQMAWNEEIDSSSVQELAEKHKIVLPDRYDPEKHPDLSDLEKGDPIQVFADILQNKEFLK